jgi:hypothetical protein
MSAGRGGAGGPGGDGDGEVPGVATTQSPGNPPACVACANDASTLLNTHEDAFAPSQSTRTTGSPGDAVVPGRRCAFVQTHGW